MDGVCHMGLMFLRTCDDARRVSLMSMGRTPLAQTRAGRAEWGGGPVTGTRGGGQGQTAFRGGTG